MDNGSNIILDCGAGGGGAWGGAAGSSPMLRIDPGMHTAPIRGLGVDAACNLIATGSEDKTVRLWALPQGEGGSPELRHTLRLPIGESNQGKVYSVALSPDGKYVAAGGWDTRYSIDKTVAVYIFEAASEEARYSPRPSKRCRRASYLLPRW